MFFFIKGTYRLPEAQLDTFLFKISVPYPELDDEVKILKSSYQRQSDVDLSKIEKIVSSSDILRQRKIVRRVHVEKKLMKFIAGIIQNTRSSSQLSIGASLRAKIFLTRAAQAWAAMSGRDFVTPEDVKWASGPVLGHRVSLTPEKEMEGAQPQNVISSIVKSVEVPR